VVDTHAYNGSSTDLNIENQMDLEKISRTIKSLSPDQRHVIILRFLEGFSLSETAAILKKTVGCVKITQFRAIWNLRVALGMDPQVSASSPETGTGLGTV
jgi:RNA polymerase sigma factor (sigma-70 family)